MKKEEFLAISVPYGINMVFEKSGRVIELSGLIKSDNGDIIYVCGDNLYYESIAHKFKPILHPMSDLTKLIEHNGDKFVPLHRLLEHSSFNLGAMTNKDIMEFADIYSNVDLITVNDLPLYLEWKFDIAGLIDKGKAIDVNTLKINPYK